ncbi:uncharacterized protein [Zea mays]|uniref:uncharacterized protein n=1 Tax=Zea mays TaxID=4577 RepID=UPI00022143C3|nr:uncharacterized protein LOC103638394 [Zea mays]|eukprot:XP_008659546.1 uncharacterized protein LOC103638394 [Zea mays]
MAVLYLSALCWPVFLSSSRRLLCSSSAPPCVRCSLALLLLSPNRASLPWLPAPRALLLCTQPRSSTDHPFPCRGFAQPSFLSLNSGCAVSMPGRIELGACSLSFSSRPAQLGSRSSSPFPLPCRGSWPLLLGFSGARDLPARSPHLWSPRRVFWPSTSLGPVSLGYSIMVAAAGACP